MGELLRLREHERVIVVGREGLQGDGVSLDDGVTSQQRSRGLQSGIGGKIVMIEK